MYLPMWIIIVFIILFLMVLEGKSNAPKPFTNLIGTVFFGLVILSLIGLFLGGGYLLLSLAANHFNMSIPSLFINFFKIVFFIGGFFVLDFVFIKLSEKHSETVRQKKVPFGSFLLPGYFVLTIMIGIYMYMLDITYRAEYRERRISLEEFRIAESMAGVLAYVSTYLFIYPFRAGFLMNDRLRGVTQENGHKDGQANENS